MPDPSGKTVVKEIGGFRLIRQLGEGGMGKVFLAHQESLSRRVALKVLPPELATDEEFLARFHREAQSAALFQHANVVNVFSAGQDPHCGVHYIAFELVESGSLEDLLKEQPQLSEERALYIARGIAHALSYAESKEIVHRDVKPDNILLDPEGNPKLADLGLAKQPRLETVQVTQTGMVLGTPLYMAPEQALGVDDLDIRADIYALGLCLWRMLTGLTPFDENNTNSSLQILTKHINEDLDDVREREKSISQGAAQIVAWMSARERSDRYQSAKNLARDLDLVLMGESPLGPSPPVSAGGLGETVSMPTSVVRALRAPSSRRAPLSSGRQKAAARALPLPLIAGVMVAALGIGVGLAVALSDSTQPEPTTAKAEPTDTEPTPAASSRVPDPTAPTPAPASPTPTPLLIQKKTEQPVDHAADPPPPPPLTPSPALTKTPPPPPLPVDPKTELAKRLNALRQVFFGAVDKAEPLALAVLTSAKACLDEAQLKQLGASFVLSKALIEANQPHERLQRGLADLLAQARTDPLPGPVGPVFTGWLIELQRLSTILMGVEAYLADPSPRRGERLRAHLDAKLDAEAKRLYEETRAKKGPLGDGRRPPGDRRGMRRNPEGVIKARVLERTNAVLAALKTPAGRVGGHAQFVGLLVFVVDHFDRWDELNWFQQLLVGLVHGFLLQNPNVRKTAVGVALLRPLNELGRVAKGLRAGLPLALAGAWIRHRADPSPYLLARVRKPRGVEPLPRAVLVLGRMKAKIKVSFGASWVTVRPGELRAKGKPVTPFPRDWSRSSGIVLQPRHDSVEVFLLPRAQAVRLELAAPLPKRSKVKVRGGKALVIPKIGPAPSDFRPRDLFGGGRR